MLNKRNKKIKKKTDDAHIAEAMELKKQIAAAKKKVAQDNKKAAQKQQLADKKAHVQKEIDHVQKQLAKKDANSKSSKL